MSYISRLNRYFLKAINSRERLLPKATLQHHLKTILDKRELFLEGAQRFGTPQYFFDEPSLTFRITQFKAAFSRYLHRYRLFYALKSNSFHGICRRTLAEGMGVDVSSGLELSMALAMGCKEIIFSGPGKADEELMLAIENRSRVTLLLDSFGELQRLSEILKRRHIRSNPLQVGVRVQHLGNWDKFGIPLIDLSLLFEKAKAVEGLKPCGIQFHTSWNLDPNPQIDMMCRVAAHLRREVDPSISKSLQFLDIGGGFWPEQGEWLNAQNTLKGKLIALLDPDAPSSAKHYYRKATPIDRFAREIAAAQSRQPSPLPDLELWMEPGRWISTPAMHILLRVLDKKGRRTVITDGGTNLLGWERPLAEFIPVINLSKPSFREETTRVFGSLCTPYDIWGYSIFGEGIGVGDILVIPDQGAYTYSLRQSFIKPRARVIRYNGNALEEVEKEEIWDQKHTRAG
ncbi:MAG: decarboxylase [Deltaproteobacteria bacterium]|nr:MAG: decarboxylase [Deltaproteobacteria bacterium]